MQINTRHLLYLIALLIFWNSCANIMPPTGGPKDEKAPAIRKRTLQDSALNFRGGRIQFEFDEFLQLKDVENQVVITPLLSSRPKISVHKKRVTIYLPDSLLLPNTTYRISMGNAIQDLHEGNAVKDMHFTFSTGPYFDSLILNGMIFEAETGKADTASRVLLYAWPEGDSAIYKQKPLYAQKSNNGVFRFENLPNKQFSIYSIRETNNNLKYDAGGERISFYPEKISQADSQLFVKLYSFAEKERPDTSTPKLKGKQMPSDPKKTNAISYTVNIDTMQKNKRTFDINDTIVISFNDTILSFDKSKIRLFQGEQFDATTSISIDTSFKKLIVKTEWLQDVSYNLQLLKSFAETKQQLQAPASSHTFKTKKESDYGYLTVSTEADERKIVSLFKEDKLIAKKNATDTLIRFMNLNPGSYQLSVLEDQNGNGVWDAGNLHDRLLPEIVTLLNEPITIKANWGNRIVLNLNQAKAVLKKKKP